MVSGAERIYAARGYGSVRARIVVIGMHAYIYIINLFMYLFMYLFVCIFTFMYKANKTKPGLKHSRFGPLGSFGML